MIAPLRQLFEAGGRSPGKRFEQTKRGLVWLVRNSVHTPLGRKTSAAHFESIPTRRLAVQFKPFTHNLSLLLFISKIQYYIEHLEHLNEC